MYLGRDKIIKITEGDEKVYDKIRLFNRKDTKLFGFVISKGYKFYSTDEYYEYISKDNYSLCQTPEDFYNNIWKRYESKDRFVLKENTIYSKNFVKIHFTDGNDYIKSFNNSQDKKKYLSSLVSVLNNTIDSKTFIEI